MTETITEASLKPLMYSYCSMGIRERPSSFAGLEISCTPSDVGSITGEVTFSMAYDGNHLSWSKKETTCSCDIPDMEAVECSDGMGGRSFL